jgi:hypothetical protein
MFLKARPGGTSRRRTDAAVGAIACARRGGCRTSLADSRRARLVGAALVAAHDAPPPDGHRSGRFVGAAPCGRP